MVVQNRQDRRALRRIGAVLRQGRDPSVERWLELLRGRDLKICQLEHEDMVDNVPTLIDRIADLAEGGLPVTHTPPEFDEIARLHATQRWSFGIEMADILTEYSL